MRKCYGRIRPAPLYTGGRLFTREELSVCIVFADAGLLKTTCSFFDGNLDYIYILGLISAILDLTG